LAYFLSDLPLRAVFLAGAAFGASSFLTAAGTTGC
jgi:hypothetical protein